MNIAQRLGDYALSVSYKDLDEKVRLEAKKRLIDSLGCAIGAFRERPVKVARSVVESNHAGSSSTILGGRTKTTPDMATFVNGLMIRYFDYNDTYLSKEPAHPSDNISACLAVGEREGASGKDLLTAMAVAYEVQCRLCDAADIRHRGWDHVCYGLVSSALAAGKLMGLTGKKLTHAVNISLNAHIAMRQVRAGELSEWKGASFANAARNAVFSAMLAGNGMTGPSPIFEGEMGFFKQVSGPFELDVDGFGGEKGSFKLVETYIKFFPAEYHAQSAIWAALEARKKVGSIGEILEVKVETHEAGYTILSKDKEKWAPSTKETADHSLPYMVGMALLQGRVDNNTYSAKNMADPKVIAFLKKIKVMEDKELTDMYPEHIANRITLKLKDGRSITEQVNDPKGHPNNPMTREEVEGKFKGLTAKFLKEAQAREILDYVWDIERREVAPLLGLCDLG
ncbi:MAG: MmgE/PrpD family protein [Thaumarchaeota archaeon]|nr:MmgE/PrpD family protein [Nitrososphaerota archaeon]